MFKKKQALHISRPQPPSFAEIIEDINQASENDAVFEFTYNLTEEISLADDKESQKQGLKHGLNVASDDSGGSHGNSSPGVETVYHEAREFIRLMEELKADPENLQATYEQLKNANKNLQDSVCCLRKRAEELKTLDPYKEALIRP